MTKKELKEKFDFLESQIAILLDGNSLEEFHAWKARQPDTELVKALEKIAAYTKDTLNLRAEFIYRIAEEALAKHRGE